LEGHKDRVWHVCWNNQGETLASCGGDKTVRLWHRTKEDSREEDSASTLGFSPMETLEKTHTKTIRRCEFSKCDTMIATVSFDATTCIWDKGGQASATDAEWDLVVTLEGHESEIKDVAWSPDGELLATCGRDKSIWIWLKEIDDQFECLDVLQGHTQDVKSLRWVPKTRALVSASYDNTIKIWNECNDEWLCTQTLDTAYQGHESTVWNLACNQEGSKLLSCDDTGMILLWSIETCDSSVELKLVSRNKVPSDFSIYSIDWASSGLIAIGSADNSISLLQLERSEGGAAGEEADKRGNEILKLVKEVKQAHAGDVNCVRFNPKDPNLLASAGDDELVKLWRINDILS